MFEDTEGICGHALRQVMGGVCFPATYCPQISMPNKRWAINKTVGGR